jgi:uncharacterized Zn-finger protein
MSDGVLTVCLPFAEIFLVLTTCCRLLTGVYGVVIRGSCLIIADVSMLLFLRRLLFSNRGEPADLCCYAHCLVKEHVSFRSLSYAGTLPVTPNVCSPTYSMVQAIHGERCFPSPISRNPLAPEQDKNISAEDPPSTNTHSTFRYHTYIHAAYPASRMAPLPVPTPPVPTCRHLTR